MNNKVKIVISINHIIKINSLQLYERTKVGKIEFL